MSWAESTGRKASGKPPQCPGDSSAGSWPQRAGGDTFRARSWWSWPPDLCLSTDNLLTDYGEGTRQSQDLAPGHPWNKELHADEVSLPTLPETPL